MCVPLTNILSPTVTPLHCRYTTGVTSVIAMIRAKLIVVDEAEPVHFAALHRRVHQYPVNVCKNNSLVIYVADHDPRV